MRESRLSINCRNNQVTLCELNEVCCVSSKNPHIERGCIKNSPKERFDAEPAGKSSLKRSVHHLIGHPLQEGLEMGETFLGVNHDFGLRRGPKNS